MNMKEAFAGSRLFTQMLEEQFAEQADGTAKLSQAIDKQTEQNKAAMQEMIGAVKALAEAVQANNAATVKAMQDMCDRMMAAEKPDDGAVVAAIDKLSTELKAIKPAALKDRTDEILSTLRDVAGAVGTVREAILRPSEIEYDRLGEPYKVVKKEPKK